MNNRRKKLNSNKGYTLVEVIVVCIILGILAGVAAGGLIAYQRRSIFKKNNEYAQTIFLAAQTALSQAKNSGQSEELTELLENGNEGNELTSSMVKNGAKAQMKEAEAEKTRLYYYIFKKGDGKDAYSDAKKMVYDMILPYIYDADILNATFCVEFDPADGIVYSVLYNDRASDFHYNGGESIEKNNDITDRDAEARRKVLLGYYGVDQLSDQAPDAADKKLLDNVKLVNGETLDLTWTAKNPLQYVYSVKLYSAETKKIAASIRVNDVKKAASMLPNSSDENAFIKCDVTLYSYDKKGKRTSKKLENVQFRADAIEKDGKTTCRLVLDAVDLEAANLWESLESSDKDNAEKYTDTYTVKRLGIQGTKMYARMQVCAVNSSGDSKNVKVSTWKQTKTESAYFGSEKTETSDAAKKADDKTKETKVTCEVKNARHLFNIRFREGAKEKKEKTKNTTGTVNYVYHQANDLYWDYSEAGHQGIVQNKNVYEKQKVKAEAGNTNFPSIGMLRIQNEYNAKDEATGKRNSITGLRIGETASVAGNEGPMGLFRENNGTIQWLEIKSSNVTGSHSEYVGMICGVNNGALSELTVDENSIVAGKNYVGGITGSDITGRTETVKGDDGNSQTVYRFENERKYENLTNAAKVDGENFVGGIVGYIHGIHGEGKKTLTVKKCENTGKILATEPDGICIGGIAGYNKKTTLEECTSIVVLSDEEKARLKEDASGDKLNGYFVGGIVGYDDGGTFIQCISGSKDSVDDYVTGKCFVGGFVGFHTESEGKEAGIPGGNNQTHFGTLKAYERGDEKHSSEMNANVTGEKYVGGVTSVVGVLEGNIDGLFLLDGSAEASQIVIKEDQAGGEVYFFTNHGVVAASDSYAGGIAGYNTGAIIECTTEMLTDEAESISLLEFTKSYTTTQNQGDYVGGVVGYNNGYILTIKDSVEKIFSITAGENYVGGIVGYNDARGEVPDYSVEGGYAVGNKFVGGYIGLNRNNSTLSMMRNSDASQSGNENVSAEVAPDLVDGKLYVGGWIGGNIVSSEDKLSIMFSSVQSMAKECEITGNAFVGGYVGYNKIVAKEEQGEVAIEELMSFDIKKFLNANVYTYEGQKQRNEQRSKLEGDSDGSKEWIINGAKDDVTLAYKKISAQIYAGGIFGYNAGETKVTLNDITSNTPITTTAVDRDEEYNAYSYAGGIIGHVTKNMTLNGCRNLAANEIRSSEDVPLGGLTELNEGAMNDCFVDSIEKEERSQIGGMAGINQGTIDGCQTAGEDIRIVGNEEIGGIVFDNLGSIVNVEFDGDISAGIVLDENEPSGKTTGGITARNASTIINSTYNGSITAVGEETGGIAGNSTGTIQESAFGGTIDAGEQTGGIAGTNRGIINKCVATKGAKIEGTSSVGGIAGDCTTQRGSESGITESENNAELSGKTYVGGIVGRMSTPAEEMNCNDNVNRGTVQGNESAGGVIGNISEIGREAKLNVLNAYNQGEVTVMDASGRAGGIVGSIVGSRESKGEINIYNAVNVGTVTARADYGTAGIVGADQSSHPVMITNCRNYGLPTVSSMLKNGLSNQFSGIIGKGNSNVILQKCFGVASCTYPITSSQQVVVKESYYFEEGMQDDEEDDDDEEDEPEIDDVILYALVPIHDIDGQEMPIKSQIKNLFDGKTKNKGLDLGNTFYYSPNPALAGTWPDGKIRIKFDDPVELNSLDIYWHTRAYQYTYGITVYGEKNKVLYETGKKEFLTNAHNSKPSVDSWNSGEKVSSIVITIYGNIYNGGIDEICFNGLPAKEWEKSGETRNAFSAFSIYSINKGAGTPLYVRGKEPPYQASNELENVYIPNGLSDNPLDESFNNNNERIDIDTPENNRRYQMYKTIDEELIISYYDKQSAQSILSEEDTTTAEDQFTKSEDTNNEPQKELAKHPTELTTVQAPSITFADDTKDNYLYNISWQHPASEEELAAVSKYIVTVSEVSKKKDALVKTYETDAGKNELHVDLEAFAGKKAEISVQAIVADGEQNYKDSQESEKTSVSVPKRNDVVSTDSIICQEKATDVLTAEEFAETGIHIIVKDKGQKAEGTYQLRAAVYSDQEKAEVLEDLGEMSMEGSLAESSLALKGLNTDYACKYIGIQVKTISDDKMNSAWTEEKLFQLPKVQLKVPELIEEQAVLLYNEVRTSEIEGEQISSETEIQVEQNALIWNPVNYASSYKIDLTAPLSRQPNEEHHLIMTRNAEGDPLTITQLTDEVDLEGNPIWEVLPCTITDYPDETDQSVTRVYSYEFKYEREQTGTAEAEDGSSYQYQIPLKGYIECHEYMKAEQDTVYTYKLILPDVTSAAGLKAVYGNDFRKYLYTNDVTITAVPEDSERYTEADPLKWWRELDEYQNWSTKIEEQKQDSQSSISK